MNEKNERAEVFQRIIEMLERCASVENLNRIYRFVKYIYLHKEPDPSEKEDMQAVRDREALLGLLEHASDRDVELLRRIARGMISCPARSCRA